MKFAILALLATTFVTTANATSIRRYSGTVEGSVLLHNSQIAFEHMPDVTSASASIDYDKGTVSLNLTSWRMPSCPRGRMCPAVMPVPRVFEVTLPIKNISANACGILTVTGLKDRRPLDGFYEELNIEDTTQHLRCMFVRAPDVRASYKTIHPHGGAAVVSKMYLKIEKKSR